MANFVHLPGTLKKSKTIFTSAMFWNAPVDSKGRTKKVVTRVTATPGFSLVSNEEPQVSLIA